MPKALFFNIPAHGHVNPSLPLVAELIQRGHEIIYFTTEHYRQRVEATGASVVIYANITDDYFEAQGLNGTVPQMAAQALLTTTQALLPDLLPQARHHQPDYILYDCMCPWGYFIAQIMKLPAVSSASLMPMSPRLMLNWKILRLFLPALAKGFRAGNEASRLSQALGQQYQVKPLGAMDVLNAPGDIVISYSSADYVPLAQFLPPNIKLIGWAMQESAGAETFTHHSERPLIYVSLGTVANENVAFFQTCITALADTPYDVLIITGGRLEPKQFGDLPDNITLTKWVPQSQVLQQAALFITHGGLNSVHEGLYCGVPLLVVPQQTEQTFNGMRVVELGAGLMLKPEQLSVSALRESATQLLSDARFRSAAQRIGNSLRSAGGVSRAVDEIEALIL